MTLVFTDGFDAYAASGASCQATMSRKWQSVSSTAATFTTGRNSGLAINSSTTDFGSPVFNSQTTWVMGFAFYRPTGSNNFIVARFFDRETVQCSLYLNTSNIFQLRQGDGGTVLATGTTVISTVTWYYIELKVKIDNTTGSMELRLDGSSTAEASVTGVDTQISTNAQANRIGLRGNDAHYDDLYLLDTTGSSNNDFLGDMTIETLLPNAVGDNSGWTNFPASGNNFDKVDEQAIDDDTSYVFTKTLNAIDTYNFPNLSTVKSRIKGVSTNMQLKKDFAGPRTIAPVIRADTTDYPGTTRTIFDDYYSNYETHNTDPDVSGAWSVSGVNFSEFGQKLIS